MEKRNGSNQSKEKHDIKNKEKEKGTYKNKKKFNEYLRLRRCGVGRGRELSRP